MGASQTYGPWLPTNYLRWNKTMLEQKMRRRAKNYPDGGGTAWHTYEFEWKSLPELKQP